MKKGIIYILTNAAMPGYVKIGKTTDLPGRIKQLSGTAVPVPFENHYAAEVADMDAVEKALHNAFLDVRANPKREFFKVSPERIAPILKLLELKQVVVSLDVGVNNPEEMVALEFARQNREAFNFTMVDIPVGATLTFVRDESIICEVASDRKKVIYDGEEMALSVAAQKALGYSYRVAGPLYWKYGNEILDELLSRMEADIEAAGDEYISNYVDQMRGK